MKRILHRYRNLNTAQRAGYIVAFGLILVAIIQFYGDIADVKQERKGCERLDTVRSGLYDLEGLVIKASNARLREETDPDLRTVTLKNRERYISARKSLVESVESQGIAEEPGSIHADCSKAYPYPWPFG